MDVSTRLRMPPRFTHFEVHSGCHRDVALLQHCLVVQRTPVPLLSDQVGRLLVRPEVRKILKHPRVHHLAGEVNGGSLRVSERVTYESDTWVREIRGVEWILSCHSPGHALSAGEIYIVYAVRTTLCRLDGIER